MLVIWIMSLHAIYKNEKGQIKKGLDNILDVKYTAEVMWGFGIK